MRFEKITLKQFIKDCADNGIGECQAKQIYDKIKLPERSTRGSMGYDFFIPYDITLNASEFSRRILTGIRFVVSDSEKLLNWGLLIAPRSGLGCKNHMQLLNTVGVIDNDYADSANEGHIMAFIRTDKDITLTAGSAFMQGLIVSYGLVEDDRTTASRNGGFGSTDTGKKV